MPKKSNLKFRRGTATEWSNAAPVTLEKGEPGFVTDTNTLKIGDGSTVFSSLSGISGGGGGGGGISNVVEDTTPQLGGNLDTNNKDIVFTSGSTQYANIGLTTSDLHINVDDANAEANADRIQFNIDGTRCIAITSPDGLDTTTIYQKLVVDTNGQNATIFGFTENTFNSNKGNIDFAVHGDSVDDVLFVDASADSVGIGTDSPDTKLEVDGQITADNIIKLNNSQFATSHAGIKNLQTGPAGLSFVTNNGTPSSASLDLLPSFSSNCGITMGRDFAVSTTHGFTMAFDKYSSDGDAQVVRQIAHAVTTDNSTVKELTTNNDSSAVGYNAGTANSTGINVFSIPFARTATFEIKLTGHNQTDGTSACYIFRGAARNNASSAGANTSTESMSLVGALQQESFVDSGMSSVTVSVTATSIDDYNTSYNDQYGRMSVKVIGIAGKTIHWVASFDATFSK